jgi:hypothetical protein
MKYIVNRDVVLTRPPEGPLAARVAAFAKWARRGASLATVARIRL